jgi:hypothetical protein
MTAHAKNRHGNEQAVVGGAKEESHDLTTLHTAMQQEHCAVVRRVLQEQTKVETVKDRKPKEVIKEMGLIRPNN